MVGGELWGSGRGAIAGCHCRVPLWCAMVGCQHDDQLWRSMASYTVMSSRKIPRKAALSFLQTLLCSVTQNYCFCYLLVYFFLFLIELLRITIYLIYVCVAKKRVWTPGIWTCVPKLRNFSVAPKKTSLNKNEIFMEMTKFSEVIFE